MIIDTEISILRADNLIKQTKINVKNEIKIRRIDEKSNLIELGKIKTQIYINNTSFEHEFHIMNKSFNLQSDGIIGYDFLNKYGATISCAEGTIKMKQPNISIATSDEYNKENDVGIIKRINLETRNIQRQFNTKKHTRKGISVTKRESEQQKLKGIKYETIGSTRQFQ